MVDEKVTAPTDDVVPEPIVETSDDIMPAPSREGRTGLVIGLLILAAIALGIFYLTNVNYQEAAEARAVQQATENVSKLDE